MTGRAATALRCAACGAEPARLDPWPFRCPAAVPGDDRDHILARTLDPERLSLPLGDDPNPFVRFRELLHSCQRGRSGGMDDVSFVALARALDESVARVDGHGFESTPFFRSAPLSASLGFGAAGVWVKDETGNVSGSHKARHLMGLALHLEVAERLGLATRAETDRRGLAIASCGNAALAAAVVARAAARPLRVFIPTEAAPPVVARLRSLGAQIEVCARRAGVPGDPCMHAFHRALTEGALPFCVQGNENGLAIEGGETLGWEIAVALAGQGITLDRLFVQVGGGALASACIQALREAVSLGVLARLPRIHAVQTEGAWPLRRAYERVTDRAIHGLPPGPPAALAAGSGTRGGGGAAGDAGRAARLASPEAAEGVREALRFAADHRARHMWPWETAPQSVAHGILDDETYDWHAVVAGMIETGGWPVTVTEAMLLRARALARDTTGIRADATGTAGLAGLLALLEAGAMDVDERVAVLFTGLER